MKFSRKTIVFICIAVSILMLASCKPSNVDNPDDTTQGVSTENAPQSDNSTEKSNKITATITEIVDSVKSAADFSDIYLVYKADEYSSDVLGYQYGVTQQPVIDKITDFVLTEPDSLNAKTLGVIIFSDDVTEDEINGVVESIKTQYVENRKSNLQMYDPQAYAIAEATSIVTYDNAVVIVAYDTEGNTAVLDAVKNAGK